MTFSIIRWSWGACYGSLGGFAFCVWCRVRSLLYRTGVACSQSAHSLPLSLVAAGHPFRTLPQSVGRSFAALLCAPGPSAFTSFPVPALIVSRPGATRS